MHVIPATVAPSHCMIMLGKTAMSYIMSYIVLCSHPFIKWRCYFKLEINAHRDNSIIMQFIAAKITRSLEGMVYIKI